MAAMVARQLKEKEALLKLEQVYTANVFPVFMQMLKIPRTVFTMAGIVAAKLNANAQEDGVKVYIEASTCF